MPKVLNLDKLIPEDRILIVGGKKYIIPGNISVMSILQLTKIGQEVQNDTGKMIEALDKTWELIKDKNADQSKDDFINSITPSMLADMLSFIFSNVGGEEEKAEVFDNSKNESGQAQ